MHTRPSPEDVEGKIYTREMTNSWQTDIRINEKKMINGRENAKQLTEKIKKMYLIIWETNICEILEIK